MEIPICGTFRDSLQQWCTPSLLLTQENLCPFLKYSSVLFTFLIFSIPFLQCICSSALWCFSFGTRFIGMWSFPPLDVLLHLPLAVLAPMVVFFFFFFCTVLLQFFLHALEKAKQSCSVRQPLMKKGRDGSDSSMNLQVTHTWNPLSSCWN